MLADIVWICQINSRICLSFVTALYSNSMPILSKSEAISYKIEHPERSRVRRDEVEG